MKKYKPVNLRTCEIRMKTSRDIAVLRKTVQKALESQQQLLSLLLSSNTTLTE